MRGRPKLVQTGLLVRRRPKLVQTGLLVRRRGLRDCLLVGLALERIIGNRFYGDFFVVESSGVVGLTTIR